MYGVTSGLPPQVYTMEMDCISQALLRNTRARYQACSVLPCHLLTPHSLTALCPPLPPANPPFPHCYQVCSALPCHLLTPHSLLCRPFPYLL